MLDKAPVKTPTGTEFAQVPTARVVSQLVDV